MAATASPTSSLNGTPAITESSLLSSAAVAAQQLRQVI
jgi:hypothetical protein